VSKEAVEQFAGRVPKGSHHRIEGARHEILQEQNELRKEFWSEFDKFMA
jgi:alpha-beta hydrolase superfamily lysophospholipase